MMECLKELWGDSHALRTSIIFGVIGIAFITGIRLAVYVLNNPPVEILNSRMIETQVEEGGFLRFMVISWKEKSRDCDGSITREFFRPIVIDGEELREKRRSIGAPPIVHRDEKRYIVDIPLPPNMELGKWSFQGETTYDCGFLMGGFKRYRTPELQFEVVPKTPIISVEH